VVSAPDSCGNQLRLDLIVGHINVSLQTFVKLKKKNSLHMIND